MSHGRPLIPEEVGQLGPDAAAGRRGEADGRVSSQRQHAGSSHRRRRSRPTTPETSAPTPMLGKHAASRHSGASQMMLLQEIGVQAGGMARDRLKNPQLRAQQELSPTTHVSHRSTLNSGSLGEDATSPHAERSGVTNSSVFVGLEREKRALVRKRPWERDLPQLSSLQHEINGILSAQNNANLHASPGTITSSSLGGVDAPFTNGRGGNESNVAYDSHNIFWGADGKRRYPFTLYHRYSFTSPAPRFHNLGR